MAQREHALQPAWLAALDGHLVHDLGDNPAEEGIDDRHEELGHAWLTKHVGPEVSEPVRVHVAATRYLCATSARRRPAAC